MSRSSYGTDISFHLHSCVLHHDLFYFMLFSPLSSFTKTDEAYLLAKLFGMQACTCGGKVTFAKGASQVGGKTKLDKSDVAGGLQIV